MMVVWEENVTAMGNVITTSTDMSCSVLVNVLLVSERGKLFQGHINIRKRMVLCFSIYITTDV